MILSPTGMTLRFFSYELRLRRRFTIAGSSRVVTPAMLVEVEDEGIIGYGEASMPPYLGETADTAREFLSRVRLPSSLTLDSLGEVLHSFDAIAAGNAAAKASIDIALHDWLGKKARLPWYRIWGLEPSAAPKSSYTIPMGDGRFIEDAVAAAAGFPFLKVKLGGPDERQIVEAVKRLSDKPLRVDVNQGWKDKAGALAMIEWLATKGVELVEQPLPKECVEETAWLRERSPVPIIADESVQRLDDLPKIRGAFDGVNIKLMKCTGMAEARSMFLAAKESGMKTMIGCMTETSCGISAAAQLAPMADWADLDGALLIANDPFQGAKIENGTILLPERPGIGVSKSMEPG